MLYSWCGIVLTIVHNSVPALLKLVLVEVAWARLCQFKSAHYSVPFVIQPASAYTICMVVLLLSPTLSHSCLEDGRFPTHQNQLLILTSYPVLSFLVLSSDMKKNLSA